VYFRISSAIRSEKACFRCVLAPVALFASPSSRWMSSGIGSPREARSSATSALRADVERIFGGESPELLE